MYFSETKESFKYRLVLKWSSISFDSLNFLVPEIFRPQELWIPRNLVPARKSFIFVQRPNFLMVKFLGIHISRGSNTSGPEWNRELKSIKVSDQQLRRIRPRSKLGREICDWILFWDSFTNFKFRIYEFVLTIYFLFLFNLKNNFGQNWWKHLMNLLEVFKLAVRLPQHKWYTMNIIFKVVSRIFLIQ